nr:pentatricopeptide repeat-containing protein [Tanacetum cinerariifolium]
FLHHSSANSWQWDLHSSSSGNTLHWQWELILPVGTLSWQWECLVHFIPNNSVGQILKISYNGQAVFTNEWDLASLEYSQETEGPYYTDLPTPDDIHRLLELECVVVDRTIKSQTVPLNPNQILTKELSPDMKQWEELIRENVFRLGGHRDRLPACLAHMLYYVISKEQYNLTYFFVKRIECARATSTINLPYGIFLTRLYQYVMETQTRRPRSDRDKACRSVSSSSSHHQGTSSHQHDDDDDDDDDVKTSRT